jgi:hypothetical protein
MRLPLLLALLLILPAFPAAAEHNGSAGAPHVHGFHHGHAFHFRGFRGSPFANGFGGWGYFPDWDWGWGGDWAANGGNAVAPPAPAFLPPPRPAGYAADTRPSVETTAQGVTIIRGPGSHHLAP